LQSASPDCDSLLRRFGHTIDISANFKHPSWLVYDLAIYRSSTHATNPF
jgi:hypothetical protein